MITLDTETIGLHGPIALIQYGDGDGDPVLYSPWKHRVRETVELIEWVADQQIIGFNMAFDWFHICQMYTTLLLLDSDGILEDQLDAYVAAESAARLGPCLKPRGVVDLMLHARKGPYQSTMDRADIRIKRIPTQIAWRVADELERRIQFKDIYFARRENPFGRRWEVVDQVDDDGTIDPNWKDIICRFKSSSALKALHADIFGTTDDIRYRDVELPSRYYPDEYGYAPFATAVVRLAKILNCILKPWPLFAKYHYDHWAYNRLAQQYASTDITKTRDLFHYFGSPAFDDDDSTLACMVGAVRWRGFAVDLPRMLAQRDAARRVSVDTPTYSEHVRIWLDELLEPVERLVIKRSTKKLVLEELANWEHPVAKRAQAVLAARAAIKEVEVYDKILLAERFHASADVIGARSSRMSGSGGDLNAQGIKRTKEVRTCFTLSDGGLKLCGGDFEGFEVTLADAVYNDPDLRADLLSGKKIHALFGTHVFPDMSYEDILNTSGSDDDIYNKCKSAVFAMLYGGEGYTLQTRLGVELEIAENAYRQFISKYKKIGESRRRVFEMFCSMRQTGGVGSKIDWHEPAESMASIFGFKRFFILENRICKALFDLAEKPPKEWMQIKIRVMRRDREQTVAGAARSAVFASAFAIQAANMRAAANHEIQSSGATITKAVQRKIWDVQPPGSHDWLVQPFNYHDEIECPTHPSVMDTVTEAVDTAVKSFTDRVPLLKLEWKTDMQTWADK